jgi:hypothetical protein
MPQFALAHGRSGQHQVDASLINPTFERCLVSKKKPRSGGQGCAGRAEQSLRELSKGGSKFLPISTDGTSAYGRGASTSSLRTRRSHRSHPTPSQCSLRQC